MAKWSTKYINDLPDSSFAYVESGGKKDETGKTVPRNLRHLPYKDKDGKVDIPHLRNALARVSQTDLPSSVKKRIRSRLQSVAKKYLEEYKTDKKSKKKDEGGKMISKFAKLEELEKINEVVRSLQKMIGEKEESDVIELKVKEISALVEDLNLFSENVKELTEKLNEQEKVKEKSGESEDDKSKDDDDSEGDEKDKPKDEDGEESNAKPDEKPKDENASEEGDDSGKDGEEADDAGDEDDKPDDDERDEGENQAKYKQLCEEYSASLKEAQTLLSVKDEIIAKLSSEKENLVESLSKFEQEKRANEKNEYEASLNKAVEAFAKFNNANINDSLVIDQKKKWVTSKMSKDALEEIGDAYGMQVTSKMNREPKVETQSSENLSSAEESVDFSKLSKEEQLDVIADRVAKSANYRG